MSTTKDVCSVLMFSGLLQGDDLSSQTLHSCTTLLTFKTNSNLVGGGKILRVAMLTPNIKISCKFFKNVLYILLLLFLLLRPNLQTHAPLSCALPPRLRVYWVSKVLRPLEYLATLFDTSFEHATIIPQTKRVTHNSLRIWPKYPETGDFRSNSSAEKIQQKYHFYMCHFNRWPRPIFHISCYDIHSHSRWVHILYFIRRLHGYENCRTLYVTPSRSVINCTLGKTLDSAIQIYFHK